MKKYQIFIPTTITPQPDAREVSAALVLASHLSCDVHFVVRSASKTADFKIGNVYWELKTPTGNGKRTVQRILQSALK